jgi:uncharacterized glyoxalase superfamily protein PhnB
VAVQPEWSRPEARGKRKTRKSYFYNTDPASDCDNAVETFRTSFGRKEQIMAGKQELTATRTKPIPDGFHAITPYLSVTGAAALMDFLKRAFGAEEAFRRKRPDGTIHHAQMKIGDSHLMIADAAEPWKPMPTNIYLYVEDCDAAYKRALAAGATSLMEPADMFYGDRNAGVQDLAGNMWWIATHIEDVSTKEVLERAEAADHQQK